jgi:hypothetical protein
VYRTKLACSLLVLGIGSCQRADDLAQSRKPLVDEHRRPAVGNIGQTGRPRQQANPRRVVTVPRERRVPRPPRPEIQTEAALEPLVRADRRPAVGNVPRKRAPTQEELHAIQAREQLPAIEPLERPDGRPAVGNTPRKGGGSEE